MSVLERVRANGPVPRDLETEELAEQRRRLKRDLVEQLGLKAIAEVLDEVCGLGPIQPLMDDEGVTEVMVNGPDALFFERDGRIEASTFAFDSEEQVMTVLDRILAPLGRRIDKGSPLVNARLANGDRVNAVVPPVAPGGPAVTIRKFSGRITSLDRLVELGALPDWYARLLSCAVRCKQSIAVAGGTGS